jgi:hypothetical protein
MKLPTPLVLLPVVLLVACATSAQKPTEPLLLQGPTSPARFEAVLQPQVDEQGGVSGIAVDSILYGGLGKGTERLVLKAPIVYYGAFGIADRMQDIAVSDQQGSVELLVSEDEAPSGGFPYYRYWRAQREVSFPVRIQYQTLVEPPTDRRGPPFNIKQTDAGVSGAGSAFLLLPQAVDSEFSRVRWDLREFREFASGISTWGAGEFELAGSPDALMNGWYMAGPMGRYPNVGDERGFSAAWLGEYTFDPEAEMEWVGEAYHWLAEYFDYLSPPPRFRVFMRIIASKLTHFSGTELEGSFMLSGGPNSGESTGGAAPRGTFIHEMIHMWVGGIEAPDGIASWFSEGLTSYYSLVLPPRAGYSDMEEYASDINQLAENYFTSPGIALSAQAITDVGFSNEYIRRTPYYRGTLYFADLDAQLRRKSGGARDLNHVVQEIFARRHNNQDFVFDHDAWKAVLVNELGPQAVAEFESRIIEGVPMVPDSDAFGPCFKRVPASFTKSEAGAPEKPVAGYRWERKAGVEDALCLPN